MEDLKAGPAWLTLEVIAEQRTAKEELSEQIAFERIPLEGWE